VPFAISTDGCAQIRPIWRLDFTKMTAYSDERKTSDQKPSPRVLAEAAIREATQVRNHPPDLIIPVMALNRAGAITEHDGPEHGLPRWRPSLALNGPSSGMPRWQATFEGLAGSPEQPGSWKPPREKGGCFCLASSM
jgi:hypothetical protein